MKNSDQDPVRATCAVALLDRGWGRPAQAITNEDGSPLQIQTIVFAALRDEAEALPAPYVDVSPVAPLGMRDELFAESVTIEAAPTAPATGE